MSDEQGPDRGNGAPTDEAGGGMHVHKPKPLHGWREIATEVGVIVVGIAIALAGEQGVEAIRNQHEVAEARRAINEEVLFDLAAYRGRLDRNACVEHRLADLETWWEAWRNHRPFNLASKIGRPGSFKMETTVWDTSLSGGAAKMPFEERTGYATLLDRLRNIEDIRTQELQAWSDLGDYDGAQTLDPAALMRLRGLITRLEQLEWRLKTNESYIFPLAHRLGVEAPPSNVPKGQMDTEFCRPVLPAGLKR
jgi:hypothetical protein